MGDLGLAEEGGVESRRGMSMLDVKGHETRGQRSRPTGGSPLANGDYETRPSKLIDQEYLEASQQPSKSA